MQKRLLFISILALVILSSCSVSYAQAEPVIREITCQGKQMADPISGTPKFGAVVDVTSDVPVLYSITELDSPPRILIDPLGRVLCDLPEEMSVDKGDVKNIRIFKSKVKSPVPLKYYLDFIVVELDEKVPFSVTEEGELTSVSIGQIAGLSNADDDEIAFSGEELYVPKGPTVDLVASVPERYSPKADYDMPVEPAKRHVDRSAIVKRNPVPLADARKRKPTLEEKFEKERDVRQGKKSKKEREESLEKKSSIGYTYWAGKGSTRWRNSGPSGIAAEFTFPHDRDISIANLEYRLNSFFAVELNIGDSNLGFDRQGTGTGTEWQPGQFRGPSEQWEYNTDEHIYFASGSIYPRVYKNSFVGIELLTGYQFKGYHYEMENPRWITTMGVPNAATRGSSDDSEYQIRYHSPRIGSRVDITPWRWLTLRGVGAYHPLVIAEGEGNWRLIGRDFKHTGGWSKFGYGYDWGISMIIRPAILENWAFDLGWKYELLRQTSGGTSSGYYTENGVQLNDWDSIKSSYQGVTASAKYEF